MPVAGLENPNEWVNFLLVFVLFIVRKMVNKPPLLGWFFYAFSKKNFPITGKDEKALRSTSTMNPKKIK